MRLIDADDAKRTYTSDMFDTEEDFERVNDVLDYAPTVDAVVVTRCKDCKHSRETADSRGLFCSVWGRGWHWVQPDGFCNYGERRDKP